MSTDEVKITPRPKARSGSHRKGGDKRWFGLAVITVGLFLLLRKLDLFDFDFRHLWPYALIIIGLMIGIKSKFRNNAPYILIAVGLFKIIPAFTILGVSSSTLALPAALIIIGIFIVLRPKSNNSSCTDRMVTNTSDNDWVNADITFGGRKETITSKSFKGGDVNVTFGGAELSLIQADSDIQPMTLNFKVTFGGVELIIPSDWEVKNNISTSMGSVEDHRSIYTGSTSEENKKTLILNGSCTFGSIEVKSY